MFSLMKRLTGIQCRLRQLKLAIILPGMLVSIAAHAGVTPPALNKGAFATGVYRNLFLSIGKTDADSQKKLDNAWATYFTSTDFNNSRLYYNFPTGTGSDDEYYILNPQDNDIRTEGMSYGMMIAVQLNKQDEFDRLWRFAKHRMKNTSGDGAGYFCWQVYTNGLCKDASNGPAPDGEEYFAMALLFAANRWGVTSYYNDAQELLSLMLHKTPAGLWSPMFNLTENKVVFSPVGGAADFTDPSYHLPAFYHLFSMWGGDPIIWRNIRDTSRSYFHSARNSSTCLSPEYANFDGTPNPGFDGKNTSKQYRGDSWRVVYNWALDYAWFAADAREKELSNCILGFFVDPARGGGFNVDGNGIYTAKYWQYYNLDGTLKATGTPNVDPANGGTNYRADPGQIAMNAAGVLAASTSSDWPLNFVHNLWTTNPPTGTYRYYGGMLYTLGTMASSGRYKIYSPSVMPTGWSRLSNGDFKNAYAHWITSVDPAASATFGMRDGAQTSYIAYGGTQPYHVQVYQTLAITAGKKYRLDFDARITEGGSRTISTLLEKSVAPYTQYGSGSFTLTQTLKHFTVTFSAVSASDALAKLSFQLGGNSDDVQIANVVLLEGGEATIDPTKWYSMVNVNSGSCVDDKDYSISNGAIVQQYACNTNGQSNQRWMFTPTDSGYYQIKTQQNPSLAIDASNKGTANSTPLQLYQYAGGENQQWMPVATGNGSYKFVGRASGRCMDIPDASSADGVQLQLYDCNGSGAQSYQLIQR